MVLLDPVQVQQKLGLATSHALHQLRRREDSFPAPIRISPKVFRWDENDVNKWLTAKKEDYYGEDRRAG